MDFQPMFFVVESIDGDYAHLRRTDEQIDEGKSVNPSQAYEKEIPTAAWRLEKWLNNLNAERKMAAKSALRAIKNYLKDCEIEIDDPLGRAFDPGLFIEVVSNETPDVLEEDLIIIETNAPIIKKAGVGIQMGKVVLGTEVKKPKRNNEIINENEKESEDNIAERQTEKRKKYDVHKVEYFEDKKGYVPCIQISICQNESSLPAKAAVMDKFNYRELLQTGIAESIAAIDLRNQEVVTIQLPYQGEWYVLAYNAKMIWDMNDKIDVNLVWMPEHLFINKSETSSSQGKTANERPEGSKPEEHPKRNSSIEPGLKEHTNSSRKKNRSGKRKRRHTNKKK